VPTPYTHDEAEVLCAGLRSDQERSEVWKRHPSIIEDFINRGLIKATDTNYADGHVERIPLSLCPT
jgi:hypothetical protein